MWNDREMHGKRVDLFESPARPIGGLLFLHDRDGATLRGRRELETKRIAVACPHGGECWWTDRIWPPFDPQRSAERLLMQSLLPDLKTRWGDVPIALAGIGMGGQSALRIAFKHPDVFPIVAALEAAVDCHDLYYEGTPLDDLYPSREHCRQDSPVLHVSPSPQPRHILFACESSSRWERGNDRLHEKLTALGVEHQFATEAKAATFAAMLEFVERALIDQSRRLL